VSIIRNAIEAMAKTTPGESGHLLRIQATARQNNGHKVVEVTIEDTGCGIPARDLVRIFEPGFTTKIDRGTVRGLGMGLFSAYGAIDVHGGNINIESEPGHGTRVIVTLPTIP
jgi:two-component system NtrC family sensor kinase